MNPIIRPLRRVDAPWQQPATVTIARMFNLACAAMVGEAGQSALYYAGKALSARALDVDQLGGFDRVDAAAVWYGKAVDTARRYFRAHRAGRYQPGRIA